jgi:hypothetical protein
MRGQVKQKFSEIKMHPRISFLQTKNGRNMMLQLYFYMDIIITESTQCVPTHPMKCKSTRSDKKLLAESIRT